MAKEDRQKLKTLLAYWIEHNREHGQEFNEWAEKAVEMGETEVAESIRQSVTEMDKATRLFSQALMKLG
jgi:nickel/cobalt transporter (NicO) family protein